MREEIARCAVRRRLSRGSRSALAWGFVSSHERPIYKFWHLISSVVVVVVSTRSRHTSSPWSSTEAAAATASFFAPCLLDSSSHYQFFPLSFLSFFFLLLLLLFSLLLLLKRREGSLFHSRYPFIPQRELAVCGSRLAVYKKRGKKTFQRPFSRFSLDVISEKIRIELMMSEEEKEEKKYRSYSLLAGFCCCCCCDGAPNGEQGNNRQVTMETLWGHSPVCVRHWTFSSWLRLNWLPHFFNHSVGQRIFGLKLILSSGYWSDGIGYFQPT